jgi:DNA-binding MarR family transcriptional regulator
MARLKQPKPRKPSGPAPKKRSETTARPVVNYKALAEFRHQLRIFLAISEANAGRAGLTSQQYQALLAIKGLSAHGSMAVGELANVLLIKPHTAVELVDRMTKLKLLQRSVDADDNRRVLLTLTKLGMQQLQKVAAINFRHLGGLKLHLSRVLKRYRPPPP